MNFFSWPFQSLSKGTSASKTVQSQSSTSNNNNNNSKLTSTSNDLNEISSNSADIIQLANSNNPTLSPSPHISLNHKKPLIKNTLLAPLPISSSTEINTSSSIGSSHSLEQQNSPFVLPSISSPRNQAKNQNINNTQLPTTSLLNPNKTTKDFKSKLDDLYSKLNESNLNNRPSLLTPLPNIPAAENGSFSSTSLLTTKNKRGDLKFDFRTGSLNLDVHPTVTNHSSSAGNFNKPSNLNPGTFSPYSPCISPRCGSPASILHAKPNESPSPTLRKSDAVNSNKFKEIMRNTGYLLINGERIKTTMDDLSPVCELGSGTCGHVIKMKHNQTGYNMAVKQMSISGIDEENKRIIMDLDVVLKSHDCKDIVSCLGYFISNSDVWICMELMSMCFDKLLKQIRQPIPEPILGKLIVSTLNALNYLKEIHNVIHRDVKPSNILIDSNGNIKLCDFGISGNLINSNAKSRNNAGCAGYMAPERIDPPDPTNPVYDIRADVWSLGVTLVELATGQYPYKHCHNEFEVMITILNEEAPKLGNNFQFSDNFRNFVEKCLIKDYNKRPKYNLLLQYPFVLEAKQNNVDVKSWFEKVMNEADITNGTNNNQSSFNNSDSEESTTTPTTNSAASMFM